MQPFKNWTEADVAAHNARVLRKPQQVSGPREDELESDLHQDISDYCRGKGWLVIHSRMDRKTTQAVGVSDFVILSGGPFNHVFCIEAKRKGNKPTPAQLAFLAHAAKMGAITAVVYSFNEFLDVISA